MKKIIPIKQSFLIIIFTIISLIVNIAILKRPVYFGLIFGLIFTIMIAKYNDYTFKEICIMMYDGLKGSFKVIAVLSLVGMLIGLWKLNGVIPTMIYSGFDILNPRIYILSVFLICSTISMILGTAVGTVSTVGIVLIGIGTGMGLPSAVIAGAVVSGAFLGDRSSPISSVLNLVSGVTETNLNDNFRYLFTTMIPGFILSVIFYAIVGSNYSIKLMDNTKIIEYKAMLEANFIITPWLFLPPVIIIILAIMRVPTIYNMGLSVIAGILFSILIQHKNFIETIVAAFIGYYPDVAKEYFIALSGGGIYSFRTMLIVLVCATSLNGIFEGTEIISRMTEPMIIRLKSNRALIYFTAAFSSLVAMLACNQVISVIIPSGLLLKLYKERGVEGKVLARTLSDSGVMLSSIIPWNVAALTPSSVMGISVLSYMPYSFLSYIMPIVTLTVIGVLYRNSTQPFSV